MSVSSYRHSLAAASVRLARATLNSCARACVLRDRDACGSFSFGSDSAATDSAGKNCYLSPNGPGDLGISDGQILGAKGWRLFLRVKKKKKKASSTNCTEVAMAVEEEAREDGGTQTQTLGKGTTLVHRYILHNTIITALLGANTKHKLHG